HYNSTSMTPHPLSSPLLPYTTLFRSDSKVEVFSCGANVPFADPEIFFGPTGLYADQRFSIIPDFIANCGMARVFAYFMENEVAMDDASIFNDISATIRKALERTYAANPAKVGLAQTSFEIALKQLI